MSVELTTEAKIPWSSSAHLGDGVLAPGGDLKSPAVLPFDATAGTTRQLSSHATVLKTASDLAQSLHVEVAGQFHTPAVAGHAKAKYESSVTISDRTQTVVYRIAIEWEPALGPRDLTMTDTARDELTTDPEMFRKKYGDYVITGYTKEAQLVVFARLRSADTASVTKAAAEVEASFSSAGSSYGMSAAVATARSLKESSTDMEIDVYMSGLGAEFEPQFHRSIDEVPGYVEEFLGGAVGTPTTAILVHYSRVDPRVPTTIQLDQEVFRAAKKLDRGLFESRMLLDRLPASQRFTWEEEFSELRGAIETGVPHDLRCTIGDLAPLEDRLDEWLARARRTAATLELWRTIRTDTGHADMGGRRKASGIVTTELDPPIVEELPPIRLHLEWKAGHEGHADGRAVVDRAGARVTLRHGGASWGSATPVDVPSLKAKRLVGYRCTSRRTADVGGLYVDQGGLLGDEIGFRAHSDYDKGFDWDIQLWVAPAEELAFTESDV